MDGLEEKLSAFLSNSDNLEKVKTLLSSLAQDSNDSSDTAKSESSTSNNKNSGFGGLDINPATLLKVQRIIQGSHLDDDKTIALLYALKPHLSEQRLEHLDRIVKLVKLSRLASLFGDNLDLLGL